LPFRDRLSYLRDIDSSIKLIQDFVGSMDFDAFCADRKTIAAVEPMLQIISEAAIRLGEEVEAQYPEQPWRNIRGLGNWLRHQYDDLDREAIWNTIQKDLS